VSISLIVHYSKYHEAAFGNISNQLTGSVNERYNRIEDYFQLKRINDSLIKANEVLYNKLKIDFELPDTTKKTVIDSIRIDSLLKFRKFTYRGTKVVANSVTAQNNFIVLYNGRAQGFRKGMGIVDPNNAIVGIVTDVSEDFSVVMSLLHKDSRISGKIFKSGETGTVTWDGKEPNILTLTGIAKSVKVAKGDSVITSGFSTTFPKGMLIGRVDAVFQESSSNNVRIRIRSAANFYNLQYGYAIENAQEEQINQLLDKARKQ
jgi:rod shape-determining protein MreC